MLFENKLLDDSYISPAYSTTNEPLPKVDISKNR